MPNKLTIGAVLKVESAPPFGSGNADGEVYRPLPAVEQQIAQLLRLDSSEFELRLNVAERANADFVVEEALIYFYRAASRANQLELLHRITIVLFERARRFARRQTGKLFANATVADDAAADALGMLFGELSEVETTRADFAEVRFWFYFKRIINRVASKYRRRQLIENRFDSLDDAANEAKPLLELTASGELSSFDRYDLKKALALLPEPVRTAFLLRHKYGWQIYAKDQSEMTIARYFDKTERTINNWLARADRILAKLRA